MGIDFVSLALDELEKWDSQLVELVRDSKINPWDIDITLLTGRYLERILQMERLDFRVPGKAVITAAVLLKLKSEKLFFQQKEEMERERKGEPEFNIDILCVPDLHPVRRVVERKITIVELVEALRSAFEVEKRKLMRKRTLREMGVRITQVNIGAETKKLREVLDDLFYARDAIEFSDLLKFNKFEVLFLVILHMAGDSELELEQEEWNGPIKIRRVQLLHEAEPVRAESDAAEPAKEAFDDGR